MEISYYDTRGNFRTIRIPDEHYAAVRESLMEKGYRLAGDPSTVFSRPSAVVPAGGVSSEGDVYAMTTEPILPRPSPFEGIVGGSGGLVAGGLIGTGTSAGIAAASKAALETKRSLDLEKPSLLDAVVDNIFPVRPGRGLPDVSIPDVSIPDVSFPDVSLNLDIPPELGDAFRSISNVFIGGLLLVFLYFALKKSRKNGGGVGG